MSQNLPLTVDVITHAMTVTKSACVIGVVTAIHTNMNVTVASYVTDVVMVVIIGL